MILKKLISSARKCGLEDVYVQHDDGTETDLDKDADNYEVFDEFTPMEGEKRFGKIVKVLSTR